MKQYNKANIPLAKELRKNMTPWERKLWYEFLDNEVKNSLPQSEIKDF